MNKKKFLIGALIASASLMGLGYAAWTDSLTITNTVKSGSFGVKFIDISEYGQYPGYDNETGWAIFDGRNSDGTVPTSETATGWRLFGDGNNAGKPDERDPDLYKAYNEDKANYHLAEYTLTEEDNGKLGIDIGDGYSKDDLVSDSFTVDITNIYPGYAQLFQADIANVGTVAAKLSQVKTTIEGDENSNLKELIGIALYVQEEQGKVDVLDIPGVTTENTFELGGVKFLRLSALTPELLAKMSSEEKLVLKPQSKDRSRGDVYFGVAMDLDTDGSYTTGKVDTKNATIKNSDGDDAASQDKQIKLTVDFLWDQFNVNPDVVNATPEPGALEDAQNS